MQTTLTERSTLYQYLPSFDDGDIGSAVVYAGARAFVPGTFEPVGGGVAAVTAHVALPDPHAQYLLATGARAGASSQAQTFTSGIVAPSLRSVNDGATAFQLLRSDGVTVVVNVDTTLVRLGVGTSAPAAGVHVVGNNGEFRGQNTASDTTTKFARFTVANYNNADSTPVLGFNINSLAAASNANFGGGSSAAYAVTQVSLWAAANNTTTTGTEMVRATINGVSVGTGSNPAAWLDVAAATSARASQRINLGATPTTLIDGQLWYDVDGLSFWGQDATTNAIVNMLRLSRRPNSGGGDAGFGVGIVAQMRSSTTNHQPAGRLTWQWSTATHASRASKGQLTAFYTTSERAAITWGADTSGPLLSFGTVTTPIAIPILATGAGATVDQVITALQNLGLLRQV